MMIMWWMCGADMEPDKISSLLLTIVILFLIGVITYVVLTTDFNSGVDYNPLQIDVRF